MEQKFKRGNLVRVLVGHQMRSNKDGDFDANPKDVGRLAIIEYSYAEKYGGNDFDSYSIIFQDNGNSLAWKQTHELEFLSDGGEHLFEEAKKIRDAQSEKNTDLNNIANNWNKIKEQISSETILFLFDKIGFNSTFLKNGEFYTLFSEWEYFYSLFNLIFNSENENDVLYILKEDCDPIFKNKVIEFFNEVQSIKLK